MKEQTFTFKDKEGAGIFVYNWLPDDGKAPKAAVQISHGMAEHAQRYKSFAEKLTSKGYIVYANDHRGHGRTAGPVENIGYCGENGFNLMVEDMNELNGIIKKENGSLPIFLLGHSMGSLLSQRYIQLYGNSIRGVVLSGTSGKQNMLMIRFGMMIAKREAKKYGSRHLSERLTGMSFGSYNRQFRPTRTDFDWLNRDEAAVDKYINDPYCGTTFSDGFYYDLLAAMEEMHKKANIKKVPSDLPIYLINGDKDPVGSNCKTVMWLIDAYKECGVKDVSYKFYKDGRHEMLNGPDREKVIGDILDWLEGHNQ